MKAKREHRVPLCGRALEILDVARALGDGVRSSFRDLAAEKTDHPREVIEAALGPCWVIRWWLTAMREGEPIGGGPSAEAGVGPALEPAHGTTGGHDAYTRNCALNSA